MSDPLTIKYVAGFMFSEDYSRVALIRKTKPAWQAGKLNGIGGKVEAGESAHQAMAREFQEETGSITNSLQWSCFMAMQGRDPVSSFHVDFFVTTGDLSTLRTMEAEHIEIIHITDLNPRRRDVIENLAWIIPLALDYCDDGRPGFVTATY